ncbi:aminotransferase [Pseudomonas rhodesiae]|uniref:aminotransferase n=1 Tax=Pseudomonas rhodesiae TaxID=76760 RepID=UPI001F3F3567|nr:aminotransferase [Pseudomonas rhodesiae]WLG37436.1 aminotransferase [Pseudomonas rhodesiae]
MTCLFVLFPTKVVEFALKIAHDDLNRLKSDADTEYLRYSKMDLRIDMARGIPSPQQIDLSMALLDVPLGNDYLSEDGTDSRNYGGQQGLLEARRLFSTLVGVPEDQIVVGGNSSLALMYECLAQAWRYGTPDSPRAWSQEPGGISFICVVPGYDRHFAMCEDFGIRMISVPMLDDGPDMELVKRLVVSDSSIKGIWCVPKYSNPTSTTYSKAVVETLASMPAAARDFRIFWDNAYVVHPLVEVDDSLENIYTQAVRHGHSNRPLIFASTSKMTLPGAGIAGLAGSKDNTAWWLKAAALRSVGPDKVNQLRQVRFLRSPEKIKELMEQHRQLLLPKFERVHEVFNRRLGTFGVAQWTRPRGGYFVSLEVLPGTAKRVVELAAQAGVKFATPGSCFPYGIDERDYQLRIAPSYPDILQLTTALEVISVCVAKAAFDHLSAVASVE